MSLLDDLATQYENARESAAAAYENIAGQTSSAIDEARARELAFRTQLGGTLHEAANAPFDAAAAARAAAGRALDDAQEDWNTRLQRAWENLTSGPRAALERAEGWARWIAIGIFVVIVLAIVAVIAYAYFFFKAAGGVASALGPEVAKGAAQAFGAGMVGA